MDSFDLCTKNEILASLLKKKAKRKSVTTEIND